MDPRQTFPVNIMRRATNALIVENDEAHMGSTEKLESDVNHISIDVADMKSDIRDLRERMDGIHDTLLQKIDAGHTALLAKIDASHTAANDKFDKLRDKMDANQAATNGTHDVLRDKQDQTNKELATVRVDIEKVLRRVTAALFGTALTLLGVIARALHWI